MAQYKLLSHLASFHKNIFVVGDEDQSIYRWRGADYHNVERFMRDYPKAEKILWNRIIAPPRRYWMVRLR